MMKHAWFITLAIELGYDNGRIPERWMDKAEKMWAERKPIAEAVDYFSNLRSQE